MLSVALWALAVGAPPQTPLAFELVAPAQPEWASRDGDTRRIVERTLGVRTRLAVRTGESLGIPGHVLAACREQPSIGCWVRAVLNLKTDPFSALSKGDASHFLLVRLLPLPRADRALVLIWLVDLQRAAQGLAGVPASRVEAWLLRRATVRRRVEVTWGDGALERAFEQLWDDNQKRLRRSGFWWPNGSIRVATDWLAPFRLSIDGDAVRTATSAKVVLPRVAAGMHRVGLESADGFVERTVTVEMGRQAILHVGIDEVQPHRVQDDRPLVLWSGVGVAAVGASVLIAGLAVPVKSELVQLCRASDGCDRPSRFARSSDYFTARTEPDGGRGPLVVPLGYSLMIAGGAWALSAALSDEPPVPWWAVLLGGVLGGAAYGISEAVQ